MRIFAWIYLLLLATIVICANTGQSWIFRWVEFVPFRDKMMHFVLLGGACLFLNVVLRYKRVVLGPWSLFLGTIALFLFATFEEISQHWIPSRTFSFADMSANWLGIIVADRWLVWRERRGKLAEAEKAEE